MALPSRAQSVTQTDEERIVLKSTHEENTCYRQRCVILCFMLYQKIIAATKSYGDSIYNVRYHDALIPLVESRDTARARGGDWFQ